MNVTNDKRREVAAKVRETIGALGQVELDGIPLADLIEPEECDGCEPGAWEVVAMEVAERLGVAVGGCLPSDYADAIIKGVKEIRAETPQVLDADGVEIRVGDEVWLSDKGRERGPGINGEPMVVTGFSKVGNVKVIDQEDAKTDQDDPWILSPDMLTHRSPVLAADGRPLREGETVWHEDGTELRVVGFGHEEDGETLVEVKCVSGPTDWGECRSLSLTHERTATDTWERLEDDARQLDIDLNDTTDNYPRMSCCRDLVRRAKALAERGK